jgi:hypothetical protein
MWDSLGVKLSLTAFILALTRAGCGEDDENVSPASLKSRLL